ncbi:hypothetical protein Tco_0821920 [Tanacetum coccineum]|uniref:Uncharacterized protein n=1 Tax=Tanacetum coccineum TaxID=301880 RepID=A0ABQ5AHT3_9ASTR
MGVLSILDREDLKTIYELVMEEYKDRLPEGFDRMLWGDLMIMFNQGDTADFWDTQQDWNLISWKLHSSSGVHTIMTSTGLVFHMLVESRYPLTKEVLSQMLELKLETEEESSMALELIKFVKQQLEEFEDSNDDDLVTSDHGEKERVGIDTYLWWSFPTTKITIRVLKLHNLKHYTARNFDRLSVGLRLEMLNYMASEIIHEPGKESFLINKAYHAALIDIKSYADRRLNVERLSKQCAQQTQTIKRQSADLKQQNESTVHANEEVSRLTAELGVLKSRCQTAEHKLSSWDKKHRKYRNERDTLVMEKTKIEEELVGTMSQLKHRERQAKEIQGSVASFFQSDFTPLVQRFLKSGEFNWAFASPSENLIEVVAPVGLSLFLTLLFLFLDKVITKFLTSADVASGFGLLNQYGPVLPEQLLGCGPRART